MSRITLAVVVLTVVACPTAASYWAVPCSDLRETLDRLRAAQPAVQRTGSVALTDVCNVEISQEIASVEAELRSRCTALPHGTESTSHRRAEGTTTLETARRDDHFTYASHCFEPGSAFTEPLCNCLGEAPHVKFGSRPTVRVVVGGWYGAQPRSAAHCRRAVLLIPCTGLVGLSTRSCSRSASRNGSATRHSSYLTG